MGRANHDDLTGKRYGSWSVVGLNHTEEWRAYWDCECDCGNRKVMRRDGLSFAAKYGYCMKCKPKHQVRDIADLSEELARKVRNRENGVFKRTFVVDGDVTYGYGRGGEVYLFDSADIPRVARYAWSIKGRGYMTAYVQYKERFLHNYLLENYETGLFVDHINRDKLDNRRSNFRLCSLQQNAFNQGIPSTNTSGIKGAQQLKGGKWNARICFCQRSISLGVYDDPYEAGAAYDLGNRLLFDQYSWTNAGNVEGVPVEPQLDTARYVIRLLSYALNDIDWDDKQIIELANARVMEAAQKYAVDITIPLRRSRSGHGLSGYKGVHPDPKDPSWLTKISFNGKMIGGGKYRTPGEAAVAYDYAMDILRGEKAWKNRDHRDQLPNLTDEIRKYVLSRLEQSFSSLTGWRDMDTLQAAKQKLAIAQAEYEREKAPEMMGAFFNPRQPCASCQVNRVTELENAIAV